MVAVKSRRGKSTRPRLLSEQEKGEVKRRWREGKEEEEAEEEEEGEEVVEDENEGEEVK